LLGYKLKAGQFSLKTHLTTDKGRRAKGEEFLSASRLGSIFSLEPFVCAQNVKLYDKILLEARYQLIVDEVQRRKI
jgi:hypothetical protein